MVTSTVVEKSYGGNGSSTQFVIPFDFLDESQVKVYLIDADDISSGLTQGVEYTLTGGSPARYVLMATPPAAGETLRIVRETPQKQQVDYLDTSAFPMETHEKAMDRMTMMIQEIQNALDNAVLGVSGSGGALKVNLAETLNDGASIPAGATQRQIRIISGNAAPATADSTTPIIAGTIDGQELILVGNSSSNPVTIPAGGNTIQNGGMILNVGNSITFVWSEELAKWLETARS